MYYLYICKYRPVYQHARLLIYINVFVYIYKYISTCQVVDIYKYISTLQIVDTYNYIYMYVNISTYQVVDIHTYVYKYITY